MFATARRWLSKLLPSVFRRGGSAEKTRPDSFQPCLDPLEDRLVCDVSQSLPDFGEMINPALGTVPVSPAVNAIIYTPMVLGDQLVTHFHPHLTIKIDGKAVTIPAGIGILGPKGVLPIHTHATDGLLHVETIVPNMTFQLRDFFAIWGQTFTPTDILGHKTDARHQITMTVNGVPSKAFGNLVLQSNQGPVTDSRGRLLSNPAGIEIDYVTIGGTSTGGSGHHTHPHHHHTPHKK
jgi:hypothetical protein